jgi:hypothetical protein
MKYVMLLTRVDADWEALNDAERDKETINRWWATHAQAGHIVGGQELHPARTATTIRWESETPIIVDGPFMEAKETIGGFGILDVPDLDAAIAIAQTWPARSHKVEIRPVVDNS